MEPTAGAARECQPGGRDGHKGPRRSRGKPEYDGIAGLEVVVMLISTTITISFWDCRRRISHSPAVGNRGA
jgi:hypothetical protein